MYRYIYVYIYYIYVYTLEKGERERERKRDMTYIYMEWNRQAWRQAPDSVQERILATTYIRFHLVSPFQCLVGF